MRVIIPKTGDSSYDAYLEEAEREKTKKQLEANPREFSNKPRKVVEESLREMRDFKNRQKRGIKRFY